MKKIINFLMEQPLLYKAVQLTIANLGHKQIQKYILTETKGVKSILDQGCGTGEYSKLFKFGYIGVDNNQKDIDFAKNHYVGDFIVGDGTKLTFLDDTFDLVFAVGLHHHLNKTQAKQAILESIRVTKKGGKVLIVDAMLPKNPLNLVGYLIRKLDRGGHVRSWEETLRLLPKNLNYSKDFLSGFPLEYLVVKIIKS